MDPLSITVAGFAFAGVVGQAAKCVQKLRAIHQAPVEIKLLLEEVVDLSGLLKQLEPAQRQIFDGSEEKAVPAPPAAGLATLDWQMARTASKLQELDSLIQERSSKPARFGIDHLGWHKRRQRANTLRADLKVLRLNLTASLGANTS